MIDRTKMIRWARRLGAASFLFFLIKGLVWLAVIGAVAVGLT